MEENCSSTYLRCLSLAPGKRLSAKKSPALPFLEKKHRIVKLSICVPVAQPDFCGCNLNKFEGKNVFVFPGSVSVEAKVADRLFGCLFVFVFLFVCLTS